jgi:acyl-CoA thioesterase-1
MWLPVLVAGLARVRPLMAAGPVRIAALGDSLVAGFGVAERDGFTVQLEAALKAAGYGAEVINAGVSGDTTSGGLARLDWVLADAPDAVLVELGANDMLRGIDPGLVRANLDTILKRLTGQGIPVLLVGMVAATSLGRSYGERFNAIYPELARTYGVDLYPFFLDGVVADPGLNQGDGLHPNARGVRTIVGRIMPAVTRFIDARLKKEG